MTDLCYNQHTHDIAIIGAGLAGLFLAHLLVEQRGSDWAEKSLRVYEADSLCGGRILGSPTGNSEYQLDLGPSWLWPDEQPIIANLVSQFGLSIVPQWQEGNALFQMQRGVAPRSYRDPQSYAGAFRIQGGTQKLVQALLNTLPAPIIQTNHRLLALQDKSDHTELQFQRDDTTLVNAFARQTILTLPPRLIAHSLQFDPELRQDLRSVMESTPTWMAGQAKVVICYEKAFWRQQGFSGAAISNYPGAILGEVFDLCGPNTEPAALGAFVALPPAIREQYWNDLPALVVEQLVQLFGPQASSPIKLDIKDWQQHLHTATPNDSQPLYEHPKYGHPWLELDHWNDKLFYCGTETASRAGGYMEGALQSAQRVFHSLHSSIFTESRYA